MVMEKVYSNSRLWLFENCPESYKIKYIDKAFPDLPKTINLFLGSTVHKTLEWLYRKPVHYRNIQLDDFILHFIQTWKDTLKNVRASSNGIEEYLNKGIKFLIDYYKRNKPFYDNTIFVEKRILFPLEASKEYKIQGYIDRLDLNENGEYEVHDYKTNASLKSQKDVDTDRQLAFYHLGLKELFGDDVKVKLVWHFLAHDEKIVSMRTEEQLTKLKLDTLELINKIEENKEWPACGKRWCDWCAWKRKNSLSAFIR